MNSKQQIQDEIAALQRQLEEGEQCARCKAYGYDRRTLYHACFYEMSELKIPFQQEAFDAKHFYTLRVCKGCRSEWLESIKKWFNSPRGAYIRGIDDDAIVE